MRILRGYLGRGQRVIVAGDVNTAYAEIDLARPRENRKTSGFLPEERAALGQFFAAGLVDTFRHQRPAEAKGGGGEREREREGGGGILVVVAGHQRP
ncbi:MAG: hypothetical protein U0Z44_00870 [Kouleothrix sp.]